MRKVFLFVFLFACSLNGIYAQRVNIDKLIKSITLEEKARMLVGNGMGSFDVGFAITGSDATLVPGAAGLTVGVPRLGIPNTVLSDGPAGLRINPTREGTDKTYYCTGFPVGVSLASTWNAELVEEVGRLDAPGKPLLFGTTEQFLRSFGVRSLGDLPEMSPELLEDFRTQAEAEASEDLDEKVEVEV